MRLVTLSPTPCPYLPGRLSTSRAIVASSVDAEIYHRFMNASFRRSGLMLYQPVCSGCRECRQIRVPVDRFSPSKSQRRSFRRNADLQIEIAKPEPTREKLDIYQRYQLHWHAHETPSTWNEFADFLYEYPSTSIEFTHRLNGKVIAVGLCDVCSESLSSVYFYFDPEYAERSLGTYGAVAEVEWARAQGIPHYYLGYLVKGCAAMRYKASFRPYELLGTDGVWREQTPEATNEESPG